jgi:hypothetical protein
MAIVERREHTAGGRWRLERTAFRGLVLVAVVGLSLLAAACGGGSSGAKVAQVGTTNSTNPASSAGNAQAYSACMRSHGVGNFPDPDSNGKILVTGGSDKDQLPGVDTNSQQFRAAARACRKLQPDGSPTAQQQAKTQQATLKFAECMRSHGVPKFPDPKPGGALVIGKKAGVDPSTNQFKAAQQTCKKFVPGSPFSAAQPAPAPTP